MTAQHLGTNQRKLKVLVSFNLPDAFLDTIRQACGDAEIVRSKDKQDALRLAGDVDVLLAGYFSPELFRVSRNLKWIQAFSAGVERFLIPEVVNGEVILTNAAGVYSVPVAEHAIALMLCLNRKLHMFIANQAERIWLSEESELMMDVEELNGKTVGIVGLGRIGSEIAARAKCFGMTVIGLKKNVSEGKPNFVDELVSSEKLLDVLGRCDFVVLQTPLTEETEGMFGEEELRKMKKTAYLINTGRGRLVQQNKLIQALQEGWIAGAGLDTFGVEPLPVESPLWRMKNVVITPHVGGYSPHDFERLMGVFCENLKCFINGQQMVNVVDKTRGY
jgi:D-2-hydroxyacid dehydrogenase (NADP+)